MHCNLSRHVPFLRTFKSHRPFASTEASRSPLSRTQTQPSTVISIARKPPLKQGSFFTHRLFTSTGASRCILSGIQPTGVPHIGNYVGAMRNWVKLQEPSSAGDSDHDLFFMLADYHAITMPQDPEVLYQNTMDLTASFLACGLDPTRSVVFRQSDVAFHTELAWVLNCFTSMGQLNRMTQFKVKGDDQGKSSVGLFTYPVLQAADILLYQSTGVPVGEDQLQHLELTKEIAVRFNHAYATDVFVLPEPMVTEVEAHCRLMSLRDGRKKMSKSDASAYSMIMLDDSEDMIRKKIKKAKTDNLGDIRNGDDLKTVRPEVYNLLATYAAFSGSEMDSVLNQYDGSSCSAFKAELADVLVESIRPMQLKIEELRKDPAYLEQILAKGKEKANARAAETMSRVKRTMGFTR